MRIERYSTDRGFKKGIVFLSGRGKPLDNFNITSTGKVIDLEKMFRGRVETCLVEFDEKDYEIYSKEVEYRFPDDLLNPRVKWRVVAHSMGAWFAFKLPQELITGMILIDPVSKLTDQQLKIPIRIHLAMTESGRNDIEFFSRLTAYHSDSAVIIHWGSSHMIHWDQPGKIASSIKFLI